MQERGSPSRDLARTRLAYAANVLPAAAWAALVFVGGSMPAPAPPIDVGFPVDKLNHAAAFLVMQLLCFRALRFLSPESGRVSLAWLSAALASCLGVLLEIWQLGVPNRSAEFADGVADIVGAAVGALFLSRQRRSVPVRRQPREWLSSHTNSR